MPFLSIIIPVYKVEPYLRECLDSIAASESDCWEAVLVDDGSPDGCPRICDAYAARDSRFRVIHQENAGVAAARNAGLDAARGEWCWFVDSDDVVDMCHIGEMVTWLEEHEEVDLVMFDLETFKDGETPAFKLQSFDVADEQLSKNDFLMKHVCYHHPRLWYHRRGWWYGPHQRRKVLRFTPGIKTGEDGEFMYKYMMVCQHPVRVPVTTYYYRIRSGSASNSVDSRAQVVKDTIKVFGNLLCYMKENDVELDSWLAIRLQGSMKILLYSIYKSRQQHNSNVQQDVRMIVRSYRTAGYDVFRKPIFRLAYYSISAYILLLRLNLRIKGLE